MRKIITSCFVLFSVVCNAQLKVNSNGNTLLGTTSGTPLSLLNVNTLGRSDSQVSITGTTVGLYALRSGSAHWGNAIEGRSGIANTSFATAVRADVESDSPLNSGRAFGVLGVAGNATTGWNYGVFGRLGGTNNGAGVYGTSNPTENGVNTGGRFAGYFNGPTKVVGNLTVTGSVQGLVLGNAVSSESQANAKAVAFNSDETSASLSDKLSNLSLMSYYIPQPAQVSEKALLTEGDTIVPVQELTMMEAQRYEKMHYALSADQLQNDFPDLVYENEDGTKAINYMELVPVLVQTINELNARIAKLEGTSNGLRSRSTTGLDYANGISESELKQNTPNPFNENTNISIYLPSSVKSAKLCVYDLNGTEKKSITLTDRGNFSYKFSAADFTAGMYLYSLIVDGTVVSTKRMIVSK